MAEPLINTHLDHLDDERITNCGWPILFAAQPDPRFYHHPDWFLAADEALLSHSLEIACVHQNGQLQLLMPWQARAQRHRFHAPRHSHMTLGDVLMHPQLDATQRDASLHSALSLAGAAQWDWQICNVPQRSALLTVLDQQSTVASASEKPRTHWEQRLARQSAWFDLHEGLPPGGKLRRNLKRLRLKLQETGRLRTQWVRQPEELPDAYEQFLALEASGWKGGLTGESTAIAADPALTRFYRRLLSPHFAGLQPVIALLWLDEQCIAAQFGLRTGQCLSLLKIAYSEAHGAYSPGSLLLQDTAQHASELGLSTLSLVSAPGWAERWHPYTEQVWHITRYANNPGGLALRSLDRLKQTARSRLRPAA